MRKSERREMNDTPREKKKKNCRLAVSLYLRMRFVNKKWFLVIGAAKGERRGKSWLVFCLGEKVTLHPIVGGRMWQFVSSSCQKGSSEERKGDIW